MTDALGGPRVRVRCLALLFGLLAGCPDVSPPTLAEALAVDWDDLSLRVVTTLPEDQDGGRAVVFLHGYGSRGSSYVPLAEAISDARTRVFLPTAAMPHPSGGAMWWEFIEEDWPRPYLSESGIDAWPQPSKQLPRARRAVRALIAAIRERYAPDTLVLAGHSQGAMLALDVAVATDPPVDAVAALGGYALLATARTLAESSRQRTPVLISHGRQDPVVEFERAETLRQLLVEHGFPITFAAHDGGHGVDAAMIRDLVAFLQSPPAL